MREMTFDQDGSTIMVEVINKGTVVKTIIRVSCGEYAVRSVAIIDDGWGARTRKGFDRCVATAHAAEETHMDAVTWALDYLYWHDQDAALIRQNNAADRDPPRRWYQTESP